MALESSIRLRSGQAFGRILRLLLQKKLMPFGSRFPVGVVFVHDLQRFLGAPPQLILDVGANCGQTVALYLSYWPRCTVHAFEPVPETYNSLSARFHNNHRVHPHCIALGEREEMIKIQPDDDSEQHSLLRIAEDSSAGIPVSVSTLDRFADEHSFRTIDFLKLDVEGFEIKALKGAARLPKERGYAAFTQSAAICATQRSRHSSSISTAI